MKLFILFALLFVLQARASNVSSSSNATIEPRSLLPCVHDIDKLFQRNSVRLSPRRSGSPSFSKSLGGASFRMIRETRNVYGRREREMSSKASVYATSEYDTYCTELHKSQRGEWSGIEVLLSYGDRLRKTGADFTVYAARKGAINGKYMALLISGHIPKGQCYTKLFVGRSDLTLVDYYDQVCIRLSTRCEKYQNGVYLHEGGRYITPAGRVSVLSTQSTLDSSEKNWCKKGWRSYYMNNEKPGCDKRVRLPIGSRELTPNNVEYKAWCGNYFYT